MDKKNYGFQNEKFSRMDHSHTGMVKETNASLSSPNLKDYFDTKIDLPHEI